jgi:hypothetical protein
MLTDLYWNKRSALMQHIGWVYNKPEHRLTLEDILYHMRTGIPWRDLPDEFGKWSSVFSRFNVWSKKVFYRLFSNGYIVLLIRNGCLLMALSFGLTNTVRAPRQMTIEPLVKAVADVQPRSI